MPALIQLAKVRILGDRAYRKGSSSKRAGPEGRQRSIQTWKIWRPYPWASRKCPLFSFPAVASRPEPSAPSPAACRHPTNDAGQRSGRRNKKMLGGEQPSALESWCRGQSSKDVSRPSTQNSIRHRAGAKRAPEDATLHVQVWRATQQHGKTTALENCRRGKVQNIHLHPAYN